MAARVLDSNLNKAHPWVFPKAVEGRWQTMFKTGTGTAARVAENIGHEG